MSIYPLFEGESLFIPWDKKVGVNKAKPQLAAQNWYPSKKISQRNDDEDDIPAY